VSLGGCSLRDGISDGLLGRGSDVAIGFRAMHHRIGDPLRAVATFIAGPLAFGIEIRFVVGWKAFDLALIEIRIEGIAVFRRDPQGQGGNEELLAGEPAAGVDDDLVLVDIATGMVKYHILDLAQLLVV
jgi:hypothetical protein